MQLNYENRTLVVNGSMQAREFGFDFGPYMADLLSGLYSDIPWALMREYGTNMRDGYVKLPPGHEVIPPEIHLPTELSPNLVFKDYGVGMSFETVWQVFSTYNASTKRDNNDEAGGLGIGAKSAFCYKAADQWTIESRYNGERMLFIATKNEQGMPMLFHALTEPTDEPNGVTITIPIAQADFGAFREAAKRFMEYFPMPLKIFGDPEVAAYTPPEPLFAGDTWRVYPTFDANRARRGWRAVMGGIPYPIEARRLYHRDSEGVPLDLADNIGLDLVLPIGAVDLIPSREGLKYTDRTFDALLAAVQTFREEVRPHVEGQLSDCKTRWEALATAFKLNESYQLKALVGNPTWNGEVLDLSKGIEVIPGRDSMYWKEGVPTLADTWADVTVSWLGIQAYDKKKLRWAQNPARIKVTPNPKAEPREVFIDDLDKKEGERRLRQYLHDKHFTTWGGVRVYGGAYLVKANGLTPEALSDALGGAPIRLVSELPAVIPAPKGARKKVKLKAMNVGNVFWQDAQVDVNRGGWFIRLNRDDAVDYFNRSGRSVGYLLNHLDKARVMRVPTTVYGIPRSLASMEKQPGWKDFIAKVRQVVEKLPQRYAEQFALRQAFTKYNSGKTGLLLRALDPNDLPDGPVRTLVECVHRVDEDAERMKHIEHLVACFGLDWPAFDVPQPDDLCAQIRATDPVFALLLDMMDSIVDTTRIAEVLTQYLTGNRATDSQPALAEAA